MSNFNCTICGVPQIDSTQGYIEGCGHFPSTVGGDYEVDFGDDIWVDAVIDGLTWAYSQDSIANGKVIHPKRWRLKKEQ